MDPGWNKFTLKSNVSDFLKIRGKNATLTHCCVAPYVGHLRQKYQWASLWTWQEPWNLLLCRWVVKALTSWTSFCLIKHHSRDTNLWSCDILTFSSAPAYFLFYFFNFLLNRLASFWPCYLITFAELLWYPWRQEVRETKAEKSILITEGLSPTACSIDLLSYLTPCTVQSLWERHIDGINYFSLTTS